VLIDLYSLVVFVNFLFLTSVTHLAFESYRARQRVVGRTTDTDEWISRLVSANKIVVAGINLVIMRMSCTSTACLIDDGLVVVAVAINCFR